MEWTNMAVGPSCLVRFDLDQIAWRKFFIVNLRLEKKM
jgi:hypothetical protein